MQLTLLPAGLPALPPVDPHVAPETKPRLSGQNAWVLARLKQGPLTPIQAMQEHGVMRLAARILDVRSSGIKIDTRTLRNGVAEYRLSE